MRQLTIPFIAAVLMGWIFDRLGLPVGWLLGPMLAGIVVAARRGGEAVALHPGYQTAGQAILGITTGVAFPLATLRLVAAHGVPLILAVVLTGGLSLLNGYLLWRWAGIDQATGFLGSLPGAAHSIVAMSDDMGADPVVVAVLQYLRLMMVVFLAPLAVGYLFPAQAAGSGAAIAPTVPPEAPLWLNGTVLVISAVIGVWGGGRVGLPSPTFLGPFAVSLLLSWSLPYHFAVPPVLFNLGMLLVGLSIGVRFDVATARKLGRTALIEAGLVAGLISICLLLGYGFHLLTGVDTMTAVLGSTPGGMDVMVATALQLGADPGLVLAMQMTRWLIILLAGPWVTVRLVR